jgi:lysophospholipid acyltransferase (LPLAT)-like uncharacterized protein
LIVARQAGLAIQPVAVRVRPQLRLSGRWDRQIVPLPFSRIRVVSGPRMVPPSRGPLRGQLPALQSALDAVTAAADRPGGQRLPSADP